MAAAKRSTARTVPRAKPGPSRVVEMEPIALSRLAACYGLLARAAFDIGIKAEGSSKLSRALEDVALARDTLAEIVGIAVDVPLARGGAGAFDVATIRGLVMQARNTGAGSWEYWRECERKKRAGTDD